MSDFEILASQAQTILQIKLDGHVEAAVLAARQHNIGLQEALQLTCAALVREMSAHGIAPDQIRSLFLQSLEPLGPQPEPGEVRRPC